MDKHRELDDLFALARTEKVVHSFKEAKTMFTTSLASTDKMNTIRKKYFTTKNWIIMLTTISAISVAMLLLTNFTNENKKSIVVEKELNPLTREVNESVKSETSDPDTIHVSIAMIEKGIIEMEQIMKSDMAQETILSAEIEPTKFVAFDWSQKVLDDQPYQFPTLTEKEIEATKKKKKAMLKALQKYDKNVYAYVPSGTFDYDSTAVSVQAFYISKTEVTNFEYRTFLFDLLMQDRKDEFLKAKPDQENWVSKYWAASVNYRDYYFSHPAYDDYPVVNITKEGAEMYCKWLSAELRKFVGEKKEGNYNDVRLPQRVEWVKAASVEGKQLPYPWDGQFVRNREGLFQANFTRAKDDTLTGYQEAEHYAGNDITAPVKSFWPNDLDLYNMSGNVAEMVYEDGTKKLVGTAGGSWRSNAEEVKIYAPNPNPDFKESSPDVGFRVVSTFLK